MKAPNQLTVELQNLLLREIAEQWMQLNRSYFRSRLGAVTFELGDTKTFLGRWHPETRTIEISRELVTTRSWLHIVEVLKHEMAHQAVHDLDRVVEAPHGPRFRAYCEHMGIPAHATFRGGDMQNEGDEAADPERERLLDRIRKLLALAESPNQHEAETAAAAAQRLMLKHNLEVSERSTLVDYSYRTIGPVSGRVQEHQRRLASILSTYFFVKVIWSYAYRPLEGKWGSVLEACGTSSNLMMADYVYEFLSATAERLWFDHKREHQIAANRDRLAFLAGVMRGFELKLGQQKKVFQKEGLVWLPQATLDEFYRARHPSIRSIKTGGQSRNDAFFHGSAAGQTIVLNRPVQKGSSGGPPKALKSAN